MKDHLCRTERSARRLSLSAAAVAALFLGACSSGQPAAPGPRATAAPAPAAPAASAPVTSAVLGWGSFFDDHFRTPGPGPGR